MDIILYNNFYAGYHKYIEMQRISMILYRIPIQFNGIARNFLKIALKIIVQYNINDAMNRFQFFSGFSIFILLSYFCSNDVV